MQRNLFKNKKVLVMGLGLNGGGVGVAKFFCEQGADVLVTDLKTEEQLKDSLNKLKGLKIKYVLGGHKEEDFLWADLILKNPDVPATSPYLEIAKKNNKQIETDINLFLNLSEAFVIGVTGTKGKSTTASLIYHLLKSKKNTFLAGNIGVSPLELLPSIKKGDRIVLELSSFELEGLNKKSPNMAVITNIMPDHLNRYGNMNEYVAAKKNIFKFQTKNDDLVLNADDYIVRQMADKAVSKIHLFSPDKDLDNIDISGFSLAGKHNLSNLTAAVTVAKILGISQKDIEKSLETFKGVPNRQEFIGEVSGVKYFNDTTATMPEATIAAIESLLEKFPESRILLICGGMNKGLKYGELARVIRERVDEVIMLPGTASDKIREGLGNYTRTHEALTMQEAIKKAKSLSEKGDIILLSPGATSFNLFKNEFDRGEQFIKAVKNLKK